MNLMFFLLVAFGFHVFSMFLFLFCVFLLLFLGCSLPVKVFLLLRKKVTKSTKN